MLIVNPSYSEVSEKMLHPSYWSGRAEPVSVGGRGGAWFVDANQGQMVLRMYRRGGVAARLSESRYLFTGWHRTRSYREFQVLSKLYEIGLPVPEPVAASACQSGLFYQAAILIRRIPDAVPLPEVCELDKDAIWWKVGRTIRRFHEAGLDHVDLNCDNILVANGRVHVIDFDRCIIRKPGVEKRWAKRNLARLYRSIEKRVNTVDITKSWQSLLAGYRKVAQS